MATNNSLAERLKRDSHRICSLILNSDLEWIDISFEINRMRELCEIEAPEKLELFDAIYVSRFERLWEQWRSSPEPRLGEPQHLDWRPSKPDFLSDDNDDRWGLASA